MTNIDATNITIPENKRIKRMRGEEIVKLTAEAFPGGYIVRLTNACIV